MGCRAGTSTRYSFGEEDDRLGEFAWIDENSGGNTHEVGKRRANSWGLFDLHGNVWEWCEDTYHANYEDAPIDGSAWTEGGQDWGGSRGRVIRGGGWDNPGLSCRSSFRGGNYPGFRGGGIGFRPAFTLPEE